MAKLSPQAANWLNSLLSSPHFHEVKEEVLRTPKYSSRLAVEAHCQNHVNGYFEGLAHAFERIVQLGKAIPEQQDEKGVEDVLYAEKH